MISEKKTKATKYILLSGALLIGSILVPILWPMPTVESVLSISSYMALILGVIALGEAKGYSKATGMVCGLFILGLIIIVALRDKTLESEQ